MLAGLVDSIARQPAAGQQRKGEVDSMAAHAVGSDEDRPLTVLVQEKMQSRRLSSQFYKFYRSQLFRARHFSGVSLSEPAGLSTTFRHYDFIVLYRFWSRGL